MDDGSQRSLCSLISKTKTEKETLGWQRSFLRSNHNFLSWDYQSSKWMPLSYTTRAHGLPCDRNRKQQHNCKNKPLEKSYSVFWAQRCWEKDNFTSKHKWGTNLCVHQTQWEWLGKERLETVRLHSICRPRSLIRDCTMDLEEKW